MAIYDDAIIIDFNDGTMGLFSPMEPPSKDIQALQYVVSDGDTLFSIATYMYGDTSKWVDIAEFNFENLDNPFELETGMTLYLPR